MKPSVASLYQAVELIQDIPPLLIGERCNANGSKKFREHLLADDFESCLKIAIDQEAAGAHVIDLCTAYAGRNEMEDLPRLVEMCAASLKTPIMIDSTTPAVIDACLRIYPGRVIVNSINLEDGGVNIRKICASAKKYGAALVALTIHEKGMAMRAQEKFETACAIHEIAVGEFGLRPSDLLFDALTFTVGAGDETLRDAALQTLEGIRRIKGGLPGVLTVLGVSNISFGLAPHARKILNSVFLHEAVEAGLDAAIVDAGKVIPLAAIPEADRAVCLDLLHDRARNANKKPLMVFIDHFKQADTEKKDDSKGEQRKRPEEQLFDKLVDGDKDGLDDLLSILLERRRPVDIINQVLVPAMRHVGELFGRGEILLPFVLQSAEVMKRSVAFLEPFMEKQDAESGVKILLATVQGDVHDIGKNLVDIILSNNGYKVFNIGIKVPAEVILEKAREYKVDVVGLSGLLVKSAIVMQENMPQFQAAGLRTPILLGGAALTPKFVAESCVPRYEQPVVYCDDAFAALRAVRDFEAGNLRATSFVQKPKAAVAKPGPKNAEIARDVPVPAVPFFGMRQVVDIDPLAVFPYVNVQALFRGRWGYRRAKLGAEEYNDLIKNKVEPIYAELQRRAVDERLVQPKVAYGYFRCYSQEDSLFVENAGQVYEFPFPRQSEPPHLCIADYFKTREDGGDVVGFFVATIGDAISRATAKLFAEDEFHNYLMLHGFSVEVTDALAEYWHERMREEMGFGIDRPADMAGYVTQEYRGSRYGFGYPACPDLDAHRPVFALLDPERIGVTLTENMEMVPEQTTSAIVVHHPQAKYFAV